MAAELDMANLLLDCLQEQFVAPLDGLPVPGDFCLRAGQEIAEDIDPFIGVDKCCVGLGWVRIGDSYPSSNFPEPDPVTVKCFPTSYAQAYEVGILGCYPGSGEASGPSCVDHTAAAIADTQRIRVLRQVACCFGDALNANPKTRGRLWTVVGLGVQGPRGTCISRVMSVLVSVPKCCA